MRNIQVLLLISANILLIIIIVLLYSLWNSFYPILSTQSLQSQTIQNDVPTSTTSQGTTYYVNPTGNDTHDGKTTKTPVKTIQKAVDMATAGDTIFLAAGVYMQDVLSKKDGTEEKPITVTGPKEAIVKGAKSARIIEIHHDYITLKGFTIDGLYGSATSMSGYRDKLLYVQGKKAKDGVNGLKVLNMTLKNGGGECLRLRYFAQKNEIANNTIQTCGVHDFKFGDGGKNGEAIYIGTAPEQLTDGKNPTADADESNGNWIHHNTIDTQGNECVDIKESATENIVEFNTCTGQKDPESGGMDSRGENNTFRGNTIKDNLGAGVRLGGDEKNQGIKNNVYDNTITNNNAGGIKFQRTPQGKICDNTMSGNNKGNSVGNYGKNFNPISKCSS